MSWLSHLPGIGSTPFGNLGGDLFHSGGQGGAMNSLWQQMQRANALANTRAQSFGLQGLHSINQGYDQALQGVGAQGEASKLGISQMGAQNQAAIGQNLSSRGLANSTIGANVSGAAGGQTAQALASVDQAMAAARAGLLTGKAHAQANAYSGLSGLALNQGQSEMGLGQLAWNRMASQPSQYQQMMQLFGGIGGLLPMLGGGGVGPSMMAGSMNPVGQMG